MKLYENSQHFALRYKPTAKVYRRTTELGRSLEDSHHTHCPNIPGAIFCHSMDPRNMPFPFESQFLESEASTQICFHQHPIGVAPMTPNPVFHV